jgi:hypothetical protein
MTVTLPIWPLRFALIGAVMAHAAVVWHGFEAQVNEVVEKHGDGPVSVEEECT